MKINNLIYRSFLLVMVVFFANCTKNNEVATDSANDLQENIFQLSDLREIENPGIINADEINSFKLRNPEKHSDVTPCERKTEDERKDGKRGDDKKRNAKDNDTSNLVYILKQLNLTERQKAEIEGFMKEYCACISVDLKKANSLNRDIIARFNKQHDDLLKAYKTGRITKIEFKEKIETLIQKLREELANNRDKKRQIEPMRKCENYLFRKITSVLDSTQKIKFERWIKANK